MRNMTTRSRLGVHYSKMSADGALHEFLAREKEELRGLEDDLDLTPNGENNVAEHLQVDEEPECIKRWAISFKKRIEVKDDAERKSMSMLEEQGLKVISNVYFVYTPFFIYAVAHDSKSLLHFGQNSC
uniref:Clathrin light chain n=1 Tax=Schistosoma mansoni TaxID=6183 RepID=A0A5K4EAD4_SCHMA